MYKTVLLPSPLSPPPSASSFLLAVPTISDQAAAPRRRLHHVSISPPTTTRRPIPQMPRFPLPPSCPRRRSPFAGHARVREPLLILLTLTIEPTCPLALADPLSTRASTKPGDTSHTKPAPSTRRGSKHRLAAMSLRAADDENQVSRRLAHLFPESGHSCPAESAPSFNKRNTVPACSGHISAD
jgi:hypothetical protein